MEATETEQETEEKQYDCLTCEDTGEVVVNAGYCGGCERCGSLEEKTVPCPDCSI